MSDLLIKTIQEMVREYHIDFIVYFGSYQTAYYTTESDIDIAFLSSQLLDSNEKAHLLHDLILYHRKSEIDLIDLKTAEPLLRFEVAKNGKVLYEKEEGLFEKYSLFYIKRFYELKSVIVDQMKKIGKDIMEMINYVG